MKHTALTQVPPITDPMGKYWDQPNPGNILLDDKFALMTQGDLDLLSEYSYSVPTGVYDGKMWKSCGRVWGDGVETHWNLRWYGPHPTEPDKCLIHTRRILIV